MQIRDQLDECCEGHSEQQAHDTPQPAPAPADTTPKELPISSFLFLALLIN
jgi:hypothetical protein